MSFGLGGQVQQWSLPDVIRVWNPLKSVLLFSQYGSCEVNRFYLVMTPGQSKTGRGDSTLSSDVA